MAIPDRIARLNSNGATDTSFDPGAGLDAEGICVNLDAAGQVIVGGAFIYADTSSRSKLAVFSPLGELIPATPSVSATVRTLVTQANGRVILGGDFTTIDGTTRNRVARLESDYTLEAAFNPNANAAIHACALQENGKILIGGAMTQVGASTRNGVARLYNESETDALSVVTTTLVQWLRGGSAQEIARVTMEKDIGAGYVTTGITVTRIAGGWEAAVTPTLITGSIRARAFPSDSHSEGTIERITNYVVAPEIEVVMEGNVLTSGVGTVDFGSTQTGVADSLIVTITNRGLDPLTLTSALMTSTGTATGTNWSIPTQPASPVAPGGTASFTLIFNPVSVGSKTDMVTILNGDPTYGTFTIALEGVGTPGPGALDTTWQPVPNNMVNTVSRSPTDLSWVGGDFTTVSALSRGRYAYINDSAVVQAQAGVGANGRVLAVAQLPDGKVMIGGEFSTVNGIARRGIARLNADGSVDTSFVSMGLAAGDSVWCFALQPDGALLVGGTFLNFGGLYRVGLARLTSTGAIDSTFTSHFYGLVRSIAVQTDNKILVSGSFTDAISGRGVARRNSDGSPDATFASGLTSGSAVVASMAVDATGKILLSGPYTAGAVTGLNRFTALGALDATFTNKVTDAQSIAVQTDGNIIVGSSTSGSLTSTERLFRLTSLGVDDSTFAATARNTVYGVLLQEDGQLLVTGSYTLAGTPKFLARVINGPATTALTVVGPTEITWGRGGTSPECQTAVFDLSQDSGATWTRVGQGTRASGGWSLTGISLPVSGTIRARAYIQGGLSNGSVSILEDQVTFSGLASPDLILQVGATEIPEEGTVPFNAILGNQTTTTSVILSNIGGATLSSVSASVSVGVSAAGEFSIVSTPATTILAAGSTTLGVQFAPATGIVGYRTAFLRVTSSNPGLKNPYDVILRGTAIAAPTAATVSPATAIAAGAATFNGNFKANHDAATAYFQYKLVASSTWITSGSSTLAGFTSTAVAKTVTGLTPGSAYHFRAVIYNTVNTSTSIPTTGTTSPGGYVGAVVTFTAA